MKTRLGYGIGRVNLGIGYERIDPGYETLGAYYFNNDFENITLDASNTFFKDKLALAFNIGYQRDDLDNLKANNTNRTVGSVNATLAVSEKLNVSGSYSNFSTFTNIKPNQFDDINDSDLLDDEIDALDYKQLSQTATITLSYLLADKKTSRQNLTSNYTLNDVSNAQGGIVRLGDASTFHNMNVGHTIDFLERNLNVSTAVNATYNTIGREESTTWGPTLSASKRYFDKTLNVRLSSGYNTSTSATSKTNVTNLRGALTYTLKERHNFNLNAIQLFRNGGNNGGLREFTATLGYNYAFGLKKPTLRLQKKEKVKNDSVRIRYRTYNFVGLPIEITPQLLELPEKEGFAHLIMGKQRKLNDLANQLNETQTLDKNVYKAIGIAYLKELDNYFDFADYYNDKLYRAYQKLVNEAEALDLSMRTEYMLLNGKISTAEEPNTEDIERLAVLEKRNQAHDKLLESLKDWDLRPENMSSPEGALKELKKQFAGRVFDMYKNKESEEAIITFLEIRWADMFHKILD